MTFLNPLALFGLIAAGIPILLHIFNLRKLKTIEFSTLSFLKELQRTKIRRLKLKQLLLLFLRILLVILIVLAFSRPTLKGSLPMGISNQAKTTAVILFDDSQSMTANDEHGELLQQVKSTAISIINFLKDEDEVCVIKLSDVTDARTANTPSVFRNLTAARKYINEIKPSYALRSIEDGLRYSAHFLSSSKNFNKEIYIVSDFQTGTLESKLSETKSAEKLFTTPIQIFLAPLGKREQQNISVESLSIPNTIFAVNRPFILKVRITNHSKIDIQNHVVSVYQNGNRVTQKSVDINAGLTTEVNFTLTPKHSGFLEGVIELEDDDLEFDNKRFFTVRVPEELRILLIGNKPDLTYLKLAFNTQLSDSSTILRTSETTFDRLSSAQLTNSDVVVLSNLQKFTDAQASAFKAYLQNGGGMLIFPGNQTTVNEFNATIAAPLGISKIVQSDNPPAVNQAGNSFVEFDKVDLGNPLFSGMFEENDQKPIKGISQSTRILESPRIINSFHFLPTPKSKIIISLTNGYPFLIEETIGEGRVLILSVAPNTEDSDFPLKGLFVPLLHRAIYFLSQSPTSEKSVLIGEEKKIQFRSSLPPKLSIMKPGGIEVIANVQQLGTANNIRFSGTDIPGIYSITANNRILDKFSVNIDPNESNTVPSEEKQRIRLFTRLGIAENSIYTMSEQQEVQRIITESRFGSELWRHFIIAALFIAFIEMLVARDTKRSLALTTMQIEH